MKATGIPKYLTVLPRVQHAQEIVGITTQEPVLPEANKVVLQRREALFDVQPVERTNREAEQLL